MMISLETSNEICRYMNDEYAISVYAMALSTLSLDDQNTKYQVFDACLDSISNEKYIISFQLLYGDDLREKRVEEISFNPPLTDKDDARERMLQEHHKVFTPYFFWLVTDTYISFIFLVCISLGVFTYLVDDESKQMMGYLSNIIELGWYFAIVSHVVEGVIVGYLSKTRLKLPFSISIKWCILGSLVGQPVVSKVFNFVAIKEKLNYLKQKEELCNSFDEDIVCSNSGYVSMQT